MLSIKKEIIELRKRYGLLKKGIRKRLMQFSNLPVLDYFYELCFCLLTPQSNAKKCWHAVEKLKECRFRGNKIEACLKQNTRFYRNKAKYIKEAVEKWPEIRKKLNYEENPLMIREWLVKNVKGLGYKEASHLLRNIGKSENQIAILDRHILKNLKRFGVIKEIPKALNKKSYFDIEKKIKKFSNKLKISLDELDLLLWAKETGEIFK